MGEAWAALLGAAVGGLFTLYASLFVELRRDRRKQIAAARVVLRETKNNLDQFRLYFRSDKGSEAYNFLATSLSRTAWINHASDIVGRMDQKRFFEMDNLFIIVSLIIENPKPWSAAIESDAIEDFPSIIDELKRLSTLTSYDRFVRRL